MEWVEVQAKTVDLAVQAGLGELEIASKDDAQVEIIQEPKPGFLGVGGREAIVKVTRAPKQRRRRRRRFRSMTPTRCGWWRRARCTTTV